MSLKQECNSGLLLVNFLNQMANSLISWGNNLFNAFSNSLQNRSVLKLTFFKTVLEYSNIALAINKFHLLYNELLERFVYMRTKKTIFNQKMVGIIVILTFYNLFTFVKSLVARFSNSSSIALK
jgi:hypothetical protein